MIVRTIKRGKWRTNLDSFLGQWFAVHPPLRFQDGLNDVSTFAIIAVLIKAQSAIINVGLGLACTMEFALDYPWSQ